MMTFERNWISERAREESKEATYSLAPKGELGNEEAVVLLRRGVHDVLHRYLEEMEESVRARTLKADGKTHLLDKVTQSPHLKDPDDKADVLHNCPVRTKSGN